ncbi:hypothetical protein HYU20_01260 [Candidatus Woesearchaeota archaeon]|nr:hypothetical protein [Candidatus Woesearchaeota archaeon]
MDKGILPLKEEAIDAFLGRAEKILDAAGQFDPTSLSTYENKKVWLASYVTNYYGQLPDGKVRQLYEADVSWVPVVGFDPKCKRIFGNPESSIGTVRWFHLAQAIMPFAIVYKPFNEAERHGTVPHERVHCMRADVLNDGSFNDEFYAYAAGGNALVANGRDIQPKINLGTITLGAQIVLPNPRSVLAYFGFKKTLKNAERALSEEFGTRGARYVIGRASFGEAKEIAGCKNGRGLEELLHEKAGADLRWQLLQQKLEVS